MYYAVENKTLTRDGRKDDVTIAARVGRDAVAHISTIIIITVTVSQFAGIKIAEKKNKIKNNNKK